MVIAAVYGPKQVANRRENYEKATLEVIWKRAIGLSGMQSGFPDNHNEV